jgi:hypothetical protein
MKKVNTRAFSFKPDLGLSHPSVHEGAAKIADDCFLLLDFTLSAASENGRHQFLLQLMHLPALEWRRVIEPREME